MAAAAAAGDPVVRLVRGHFDVAVHSVTLYVAVPPVCRETLQSFYFIFSVLIFSDLHVSMALV